MKYESAILKRLIDTYGVVGNPRYISEIIKEFIVRGKECFPNLFTYQSDWLAHIDEFGLKPSYTVSYTGQSIYAPNTLEKPVKSAILKGNTLSSNPLSVLGKVSATINDDNSVTMNADGGWHHIDYESSNYIGNKTTFVVLFSENTAGDDLSYFQFRGFNVENKVINTNSFKYYGTITDSRLRFGLNASAKSGSVTFRVMLLDGDYSNHDIPYTFGIQSVKMPVLTTSNEDGTKTNILTVNEDVVLRGIGDVKDELDLLTGELTERIGEVVLDENNSTNFILKGISDNTVSFWCLHNASSPFVNISKGEDLQTLLCDKIVRKTNFNEDVELIHSGTGAFVLRILKNKLQTQDINGLTLYLQSNPITVQYKLATESVKTVDLTILDQNGQNVKQLMSFIGGTHFNTKSSEGSPLPTVVVSVETDLEETLKVCSLEGNTL